MHEKVSLFAKSADMINKNVIQEIQDGILKTRDFMLIKKSLIRVKKFAPEKSYTERSTVSYF